MPSNGPRERGEVTHLLCHLSVANIIVGSGPWRKASHGSSSLKAAPLSSFGIPRGWLDGRPVSWLCWVCVTPMWGKHSAKMLQMHEIEGACHKTL